MLTDASLLADSNSSSRSIYDAEIEFHELHDRLYTGDSDIPCDEMEQDRMHIVHQVFLHLFNRELTTVMLHNPTKILDIGTGTGDWAIGMADFWPECEGWYMVLSPPLPPIGTLTTSLVTGVDLTPMQPTAVPVNVFFEIDNCEVRHNVPTATYLVLTMQ